MNKRWVPLVAAITACASTEVLGTSGGSPDAPLGASDAGSPLDSAPPEIDAGPCEDCEYFPEVCAAGMFCPSGPFDPGLPGGAFDPRTLIVTVRGRSASDVWVAGALGAVAHFDGTSWRRSDLGASETLRGLWLRESSEIAIGLADTAFLEQHVYAHGPGAPDGGAPPSPAGWSRFTPPLPADMFPDVVSAWAAPGAESSWIAIESVFNTKESGVLRLRQTSPSGFEVQPGPASPCWPGCNEMKAVHGASADDIWAVGAGGTTLRITEAESEAPSVKIYNSLTWNSLNGVWAASESEAWTVGANGTIRHFTGQSRDWDIVEEVPTNEHLNAVWGASDSDIWAVGDRGVVLHYDGKTWSRVKVAGLGAGRPKLTSVWAAGPEHVWIGGLGVVLSLRGAP